MATATFSVIIPTYNRLEKLKRSLNSLMNQSYDNFEIVVVNDGSTDGTTEFLDSIKDTEGLVIVNHQERQERVASRNDGMLFSSGDWICWLDSDDEYSSNYFEVLNDAINYYPDYKIFNFGAIIHYHRNHTEYWTKIRETFKPPVERFGHVSFKSGHIGSGSFIFHRDLINEVGLMIPSVHPYGNPGCFPELNRNPEYPMRDDGQWIPMGNPFGDDYMWFWKLTRDYQSKPLDMLLYIQHLRG